MLVQLQLHDWSLTIAALETSSKKVWNLVCCISFEVRSTWHLESDIFAHVTLHEPSELSFFECSFFRVFVCLVNGPECK